MATRRTTKKAKAGKAKPVAKAKKRVVRPKAAKRRAPAPKKPKRKSAPVATRTAIDTGWSWDDAYPLAQGIQHGPAIFVSGQVALDPEGMVVGLGDVKAQTHQAFRNVAAVLAKAGADLGDIVKITSYVTDESTFNEMLEARREVFGENPPASTAVVVKRLALPELLIEVEAIAIKP